MKNRPLSLLLNTLAWACLGLFHAQAQDPALGETFQQGKTLWGSQGDKDGATLKFEQVIAALEPKARSLSPEWIQILCESYNWIAVLDDRTPARRPRVQKDLEAILALNPDFDIDRNITNARLQGIFDGLRTSRLGKVKLTVSPEGGSLLLDGKPSSLGPGGVKYLSPGSHALAYVKPGYQTVEQQVEVSLKEGRTLEFTLVRASSTLILNTYPNQTEVLLDGKSLGTTQGQAPPTARPLAEKAGVNLEQLSGDFIVSGLTAGKHVLEIRAECFQTKRIAITEEFTTPFADHLLEPIKLEPARGTLTIETTHPGGELFLSGKSMGPVPVKNLQVCAGSYDLQIRFPLGGFSQKIDVADGSVLSVQARPKPRLAYLGLDGSADFAGKDRLLKALAALGDRLKEVAFIPPKEGEPAAAALTRYQSSKDAELLLVARPIPGTPVNQLELSISALTGEEEKLQIKPLESEPLENLINRLNARVPLAEPWAGLTLLDLPGEPGPWVLQADAAALKAGIKTGTPLTGLNGKPVTNVQAFRKALKDAKGDSISVSQGDTTLTLAISQPSLEIPTQAAGLCYPLLLMDLRLRLPGATGDQAALLKLQQALALMHFRKYDKAMELLRDVKMNATQGVSQGTLDYYTGICLMRLGRAYAADAGRALNQAMKSPQATLFGPEGPWVTILAKQALEELKP